MDAHKYYSFTEMTGSNDSCPCDTINNETCIQCSGCLDKYWSMNGQYEDCMTRNAEINEEIGSLRDDLESRRQCALELKQLQECNAKVKEIQDKLDGVPCQEFESEIKALMHDLGECNVEWGACQQLERQSEVLDKRRLEEIERQKNLFEMCNEQLKQYKNKMKQ